MKHLIISAFLTACLFSVHAQSDSASNSKLPINNTNMNSVRRDSTGSINNSIMNNSAPNNNITSDSTHLMNDGTTTNSMRSDSAGTMNSTYMSSGNTNTMRSDSSGSTNNTLNSNMNNGTTSSQSNMNNSGNANQMNSTGNSVTTSSSANMIANARNIPGQEGYAALPILETYVPADVIPKIKSKYNSVYAITTIKHTADQTAYVVKYADNGVYKTELIGEDGNVIQ